MVRRRERAESEHNSVYRSIDQSAVQHDAHDQGLLAGQIWPEREKRQSCLRRP
jgi:hypothetical protein